MKKRGGRCNNAAHINHLGLCGIHWKPDRYLATIFRILERQFGIGNVNEFGKRECTLPYDLIEHIVSYCEVDKSSDASGTFRYYAASNAFTRQPNKKQKIQ